MSVLLNSENSTSLKRNPWNTPWPCLCFNGGKGKRQYGWDIGTVGRTTKKMSSDLADRWQICADRMMFFNLIIQWEMVMRNKKLSGI